MTFKRIRNGILAAAVVIGAVACGGGGVQLAGGGIGGTGVSQGPITGFGSIFVNGVEFDTAGATITKDGAPVTQANLQIGMVVTVDGSIDSSTKKGTATTVTYAKELEGPITEKGTDTLTVLGQVVTVDNLTTFSIAGIASPSLGDLQVDDSVEVSGLLTANGLRATFIAKKAAGAVELKGTISAIGASTLTVGTQMVDISGLTLSFTPVVGDYVEVNGSLAGANLVATSVQRESRSLPSLNKDQAELKGFVTDFTSSSDFVVNGQRVQTSSSTAYRGGTAADIKNGLLLEIEGPLNNGVLQAAKISFQDDQVLEGMVASDVVAADGITHSITLAEYPDSTVSISPTLTLGANTPLSVGTYVKIHGRLLPAGCATAVCLLATELETPSTSSEAELQGTVTAVSAPFVTIMGMQVNTTGFPDSAFTGTGITGRTSFFGTVQVGDLIELKGTRAGTTVTWTSIGIED